VLGIGLVVVSDGLLDGVGTGAGTEVGAGGGVEVFFTISSCVNLVLVWSGVGVSFGEHPLSVNTAIISPLTTRIFFLIGNDSKITLIVYHTPPRIFKIKKCPSFLEGTYFYKH